jgi:hypothetical protein
MIANLVEDPTECCFLFEEDPAVKGAIVPPP